MLRSSRSLVSVIQHSVHRHSIRRSFSRNMVNNKTAKVQVKQGVLIGLERQLPSGLNYESFHGIPYAVPPVGKLRFKSPIPLDRFDVPELDCRKERDVSYQKDLFLNEIVGSENCLFLNVFAPKLKDQKPLPVMVWIHGGGFLFGNGNSDYHFPAKLMEEGVIVVTLNYRLSAFGFLYLPQEGIYGNAGLKDQRLALQWIQENIANFSGDPQNVTLFGESAGAASVHLHTCASHVNKLFHKAIMQSGSGNMEWVFQLDAAAKTRRLAELLGYQGSTSNTRELLDFLQSPEVTPLKILKNTINVLTAEERRRSLPLAFKPVIEDAQISQDSFINEPLLQLLYKKDRLQNCPVLMGYNTAEGLTMLVNSIHKLSDFDEDLERLLPRKLMPDLKDPAAHNATTRLRDFYFQGEQLTEKHLNSFVDLFTDYYFNVDLQRAAEVHFQYQTQSPVYFYRFEYIGDRNLYKRMFQFDHLKGVCHADELFYLFQMADDKTPTTQDDDLMSKRICQLWANFARYGDPSTDDCKWSPVQRRTNKGDTEEEFQLDYLALDRKCEMRKNPDHERINFWLDMYKTYRPDCHLMLKAKL